MRTVKKLLQLPPFKPELYVKRTIAVSFWKDSNDLLWRASIFKSHVGHDSLSTKAKTYVDMIMAMECALKSLIVSLSIKTETPENAYLKARSCSHNLKKLYAEAKLRAKNRVKLLSLSDEQSLIKANTLGVGFRYDVTSFMLLSQEDWADRSQQRGNISSVINHNFIDEINRVAHLLNKLSSETQGKYLGDYSRINTARLQEINDRHRLFLTNLGSRF